MTLSCIRPLWKCLFNFILQNCKNTVGACLPDGVFYLLPLFCTAVLALLSHTKTGDKMKKCVRAVTAILAVVLAVIYGLVGFGCWALPDTVRTGGGDAAYFGGLFTVSGGRAGAVDARQETAVSGTQKELRLLNAVPVKTVALQKTAPRQVAVSGSAFGIKIYTDGVLVVGTRDVQVDGKAMNPAAKAGIQSGDLIVAIDGKKVSASEDVAALFSRSGGAVSVQVKRDGKYKTFSLTPVYSKADGCWKAGVWVRDSTAGIGTVTYYDPQTGVMAALGHPITDVDTGEIMPILRGEAVAAKVTKIYKSKAGSTGSICCDFLQQPLGALTENDNAGVFGRYSCSLKGMRTYPVATAQQVENGDCQVLTTVDGDNTPRLYKAKIIHISYRGGSGEKNMIVRITDPVLLAKTGGIVQGMSGSPILQNGRLVGALTHVIVDSPRRGYAIFAESMLAASDAVAKDTR